MLWERMEKGDAGILRALLMSDYFFSSFFAGAGVGLGST